MRDADTLLELYTAGVIDRLGKDTTTSTSELRDYGVRHFSPAAFIGVYPANVTPERTRHDATLHLQTDLPVPHRHLGSMLPGRRCRCGGHPKFAAVVSAGLLNRLLQRPAALVSLRGVSDHFWPSILPPLHKHEWPVRRFRFDPPSSLQVPPSTIHVRRG